MSRKFPELVSYPDISTYPQYGFHPFNPGMHQVPRNKAPPTSYNDSSYLKELSLRNPISAVKKKARKRNELRNFFSKFRSLEEFRNYRKTLKRTGNKEVMKQQNLLLVKRDEVLNLKKEIVAKITSEAAYKNGECGWKTVCQKFARAILSKLFPQSEEMSKCNSKHKITCHLCPKSLLFKDDNEFRDHLTTEKHIKLCQTYIVLLKIGYEYFQKLTEPNFELKMAALGESSGVIINLKDESSLYSSLDPHEMKKESFIQEALDKISDIVLPKPSAEFICKCCNCTKFPSKAALERHLKSARHLEFERHYTEAFCISCCKHCGDLSGMKKHTVSAQHKEILELLEFAKQNACCYWDFWRSKDPSELKDSCSSTEEMKNEVKQLNEPCVRDKPVIPIILNKPTIPLIQSEPGIPANQNEPAISIVQNTENKNNNVHLSKLEDQLIEDLKNNNFEWSKEEFVTSVLESALDGYWPLPSSNFFCRCCNYIEFETMAALKKHSLSIEHNWMKEQYKEAFCLCCQVHTVNSYGMKWHCKTDYHLKLSGIMEETEKIARIVWKNAMIKDKMDKIRKKPFNSHQVSSPGIEKGSTNSNPEATKPSGKENRNGQSLIRKRSASKSNLSAGIPMWY